jgi:GNAT superfamily N-acetyltransferase
MIPGRASWLGWQGGEVASQQAPHISLRTALESDLRAISDIGRATGQDEDWDGIFPGYIGHLIAHGSLLVAERDGGVLGYGGTLRIGNGPQSVSMLTDLFVDPAVHGSGTGRALLSALWADEPRRMTFSSLHRHALPLYTSFGVDAWWPLLYLRGDVRRLPLPDGWSVEPAAPEEVGALEREWTGIDRTAQHQFWAGWPRASGVVASHRGEPAAAGTVGGADAEFGLIHLAVDATAAAEASASSLGGHSGHAGDRARGAVIAVLSWLDPGGGLARSCLPAPHPATRALLRAGWRIEEYDLYMASEPGLIDPRGSALSPAFA